MRGTSTHDRARPPRGYLQPAEQLFAWVRGTRAMRRNANSLPATMFAELDGYIAHAERQIDQIRQRVLKGKRILHADKVFSVFEPHKEWISKGKAGLAIGLGCA